LSPERLVIVYNAKAGMSAGIKDSLHKLLSPDTYPCSLCALTHGALRIDPVWKDFLARVPFDIRVYHRPDFRARYPDVTLDLPLVAREEGQALTVLIDRSELASISDVGTLIACVRERWT
jgi:hypothetical protein